LYTERAVSIKKERDELLGIEDRLTPTQKMRLLTLDRILVSELDSIIQGYITESQESTEGE